MFKIILNVPLASKATQFERLNEPIKNLLATCTVDDNQQSITIILAHNSFNDRIMMTYCFPQMGWHFPFSSRPFSLQLVQLPLPGPVQLAHKMWHFWHDRCPSCSSICGYIIGGHSIRHSPSSKYLKTGEGIYNLTVKYAESTYILYILLAQSLWGVVPPHSEKRQLCSPAILTWWDKHYIMNN